MDDSKKYLEDELGRIEGEIRRATELVGELGEEAEKEIAVLMEQKKSLLLALEPHLSESTGKAGENFNCIILEVRPGVGGEEAKIWAGDLLRMYTRYAESKKWKIEPLDDGVIKVRGDGAWGNFKFETGVHRVQRVPETEAQGRIHTSTSSVVVLPEVPETQIEVKEDDLLWEFTRSGGHGGQNVNKVATAVRLTHRPTGIVVQARQERFQEQNRKIALELLRSQLWEIEEEKKRSKIQDSRSKIGRSMRAEKIRTYNFPQNRVTDHRIGKSWHRLEKILEGDLEEVVESMHGLELD